MPIICKHNNQPQTITCTDLPAICFSLIILNKEGEKIIQETYLGENAAEAFTKLLLKIEFGLMSYIERYCELQMTEEDQDLHDMKSSCEDCGAIFSAEVKKCRDHCHSTGRYRAALCNFCNLQRKKKLFIPLYAHNFSGFDAHLVIEGLQADKKRFSTLSRNTEKIITMNIGRFKLIDSSSFMPESLEVLTANLKSKGECYFENTKKWLEGSRKKFDLLSSKGCYPYEYLTEYSKVFETCLPSKEKFYSSLKDAQVSDSEYKKAQEVWNEFDCKTIACYTKLYCQSDVFLLSDVWANFANETSKNLFIHPEAGYISLPSYAFDAFKHKMKMEQQEYLQVPGIDQKRFQEDVTGGIRGGSCMVKQKSAFDSAMKNYLLKQANETELKEYAQIMKMYKDQAKTNSLKVLRKTERRKIPLNICQEEGCTELVVSPSKKCCQHEEWTILALDYNNLS